MPFLILFQLQLHYYY